MNHDEPWWYHMISWCIPATQSLSNWVRCLHGAAIAVSHVAAQNRGWPSPQAAKDKKSMKTWTHPFIFIIFHDSFILFFSGVIPGHVPLLFTWLGFSCAKSGHRKGSYIPCRRGPGLLFDMDLLLSVQVDALNKTQELKSCSVLYPVLLFILFILRCKDM